MTRDQRPTRTPLVRMLSPLRDFLATESAGALLIAAGAVVALVWANSPWSGSYFALRDIEVGYAPWHLKLTLAQWASDGALAIFFFLVGLELKREFLIGDLRRFGTAIVPILAAAGGVITPALFYLGVTSASSSLHGGALAPDSSASPGFSAWLSRARVSGTIAK